MSSDMASSGQTTKRKVEQLGNTEDHPCKRKHRDLRLWNSQKAECCLSCGSFYTFESDLHAPFKFGDEIRLLEILPSIEDSDDLIGDLVHVRLQDNPEYEAVSYTWADEAGDARQCGNLIIKSRSALLKITKNCEAALRKFRGQQHTRLLWIDSICIDQQNSLERSEQVQMMTSIYKQAQKVLVFIGNPPELELETYRRLFDYINNCKRLLERLKGRESSVAWKRMLYKILSSQGGLRSILIKFLGQSWFHRIWIVQEVAMARVATLYFGPFIADWEDFSLDLSMDGPKSESNNAFIPIDPAMETHVPPVLRLRREIKSEGARLVDLLAGTRTCAATDPRDKIFALLGMARQETGLNLPRADYTRSVSDVFLQATTYHIRSTRSLDILSLPPLPSATTASWVSDFSGPPILPALPAGRDCTAKTFLHRRSYVFFDDKRLDLGILSTHAAQLEVITYIQDDHKWIQHISSETFRIDSKNPSSSLQRLFQASSNFHIPEMLLHCPKKQRASVLFSNLPFDIDPENMLAIDLLAPFWEQRENQLRSTRNSRMYFTSILEEFHQSIRDYGRGRAIFCGKYAIGIVPHGSQPGDHIWVLPSVSRPLVLRPEGENFRVIGTCLFMGPGDHSNCTSKYHGIYECASTSCKSRAEYWKGTMERSITLV